MVFLFRQKGNEKKRKNQKKKGEKAVTLSCFLRSNIDTMANNRMHQTQQQPLWSLLERRGGGTWAPFPEQRLLGPRLRKVMGIFFFELFQESCFHPYIGVHILCTALDPFKENLRAYFKGIYFI